MAISIHPAGRFSNGHSLHPVNPSFVLQPTESTLASYFKYDFLEAAYATLIHTDNIYSPTLGLSVATVHTEEVSRKQRGFITTRPSPDFYDNVLLIIGVPG